MSVWRCARPGGLAWAGTAVGVFANSVPNWGLPWPASPLAAVCGRWPAGVAGGVPSRRHAGRRLCGGMRAWRWRHVVSIWFCNCYLRCIVSTAIVYIILLQLTLHIHTVPRRVAKVCHCRQWCIPWRGCAPACRRPARAVAPALVPVCRVVPRGVPYGRPQRAVRHVGGGHGVARRGVFSVWKRGNFVFCTIFHRHNLPVVGLKCYLCGQISGARDAWPEPRSLRLRCRRNAARAVRAKSRSQRRGRWQWMRRRQNRKLKL